jgi:hypothetical protein
VDTIMVLLFPQIAEMADNFVTSWATTAFQELFYSKELEYTDT